VLAKPYYEVIGTFELEKDGMVNVNVDTREQCLKLFEITEVVPEDLVKVITSKASLSEGVLAVTVSISKAKIAEGFAKQKYKWDLQKRKFELKAVAIE